MLGMDQGQRSNAVGFNTAYLPDGEGARHGGGTYTGQAVEPTIQDYENFFGPSARDIKTDLQRFKRHGRWHLPDILQGPNPWLTDRIDGLITDATNSPFTTKILPYRYKEEVDGKIKWNVWSFDEGMASRVPYESAARTLTQSKRSFAGYMVRQGMAIVLEHNFMMTPKGRENFRNQLNQLIGSIQYTNDLDVHMALILAPSYQKTMRERYYTSDKSPAQICREFADLFGMMQKNVNALDILIEEGKAILRTWGGPMPDFLLCNSKLTFQMTMTPEKTNYITQGIDGVKRLRQGPDLGSYRGLSIIHSRSFAMETGQHPRDVLRRRVRTAEYYRILPSKKNVNREFEFYNEERDTWFTLSFHDLLKCARYEHEDGNGNDNAAQVDGIYHRLAASAAGTGSGQLREPMQLGVSLPHTMLGARYQSSDSDNPGGLDVLVRSVQALFANHTPLSCFAFPTLVDIRRGSGTYWYLRGFTDNLGIKIIPPKNNEVWDIVSRFRASARDIPPALGQTMLGVGPLSSRMLESMYMTLKGQPLNDPFARKPSIAAPGTGEWFAAYAFYLEIFKRGGLACDYVTDLPGGGGGLSEESLDTLSFKPGGIQAVDVSCQYLAVSNAIGSVNHQFHLSLPLTFFAGGSATQATAVAIRQKQGSRFGSLVGHRALLTIDVLAPLLAKYDRNGTIMTGLQLLLARTDDGFEESPENRRLNAMVDAYNSDSNIEFSIVFNRQMQVWIRDFFKEYRRVDSDVGDGELLALAGISTIPMYLTSQTHILHRVFQNGSRPLANKLATLRKNSFGHLSIEMLEYLNQNRLQLRAEYTGDRASHPWFADVDTRVEGFSAPDGSARNNWNVAVLDMFSAIHDRLTLDPYFAIRDCITPSTFRPAVLYACNLFALEWIHGLRGFYETNPRISAMVATGGVQNVVLDLNQFFDASMPYPRESHEPGREDLSRVENVELVIVRPNIEHNMLGVIMGLGGESLGNTLWGQTELSVYDDSMHGIWGMSYKYHERAIVFNEKNLIRMWDIAYDGYNGGKDDTYVNWLDKHDESAPHGPTAFKEATLDLSKNYRGPSMMVMAFVHDRTKQDDDGRNVYDHHFRRNWPSPIVFYDLGRPARETLAIDYDNVQTVDVQEFRVFNNPLYDDSYRAYRDMMPEFRSMHLTRKTAGQSSADAETATDSLAFQGSMRIKEGGMVIQEVQGSGHHGPDYVGIASVRAGKGQKVAGQAPAPYRLV